MVSKKERPDKIPAFSIPKFGGDRMDGKSWIDSVERKFKGSGVIKYLTDGEVCDDNDENSSAFTSRLLDSIAESDILSYMATELKDEENSADVWEKIEKVLQSSDLTLLRILRDWQKFFRLRCETLEEFPQFYSDLRKITSDLRTAKSVAVGETIMIHKQNRSCNHIRLEPLVWL